MSHRLITLVTLGSALGCGLVAGVFFAFSTFIMPALARLPAAQGILAMNSINVTVINRWFLGVFLGSAGACGLLAVTSFFNWAAPGAGFRLAGGLTYIVGCTAVTRAFNIPRNDALAAVQPESADGAAVWARYLVQWTAWNHVRTVACLAAAALLILALLGPGGSRQ